MRRGKKEKTKKKKKFTLHKKHKWKSKKTATGAKDCLSPSLLSDSLCFPSPQQKIPRGKSKQRELVIVCYNVHAWRDAKGVQSFEQICEALACVQPDIVGLAEVKMYYRYYYYLFFMGY